MNPHHLVVVGKNVQVPWDGIVVGKSNTMKGIVESKRAAVSIEDRQRTLCTSYLIWKALPNQPATETAAACTD
jgi:hypothetical protein